MKRVVFEKKHLSTSQRLLIEKGLNIRVHDAFTARAPAFTPNVSRFWPDCRQRRRDPVHHG